MRLTKHGLTSAELTHELRNPYDASYLDDGKVYGGGNKKSSIKSRFISTDARIPPGPLLDLLKDLVDVCAVRYEDAPPGEDQKKYDVLLQHVVRDPSLMRFLSKHPVKDYYDRKEKLNALWKLGRFKDAVDSGTWDLELKGQRCDVNEVVITTKRREFETDMPRQSKKFKPIVDGDDNAASNDLEEEASECADSKDDMN